jgi:hypothetical protein
VSFLVLVSVSAPLYTGICYLFQSIKLIAAAVAKQAAAEASHKARYGSEQVIEFAEGEDSARKNLAGNGSVGPVEDVSEDFSKMNRGTDVITEK